VTEPRLFTETSFVVTATPNAFGRALLRLVKQVDTDPRHWVRDRSGEPIATIVPVTSRLRKAFDGYTRHDVLDASGTKLLALRASVRTLVVDDAEGNELGLVHNATRRGQSQLDITFHAGDWQGEGIIRSRPPEIGRVVPRQGFPRGAYAYGVIEIADGSGATVATTTNTDMFDNVVELAPSLEPPLRLLAVGFACSLVDHGWMHVPARNNP
jgi:hypothetical protein